METILQGLQELEGVHGAIVVNGSGRLVAHRAHNLFDNDLLQQVSQAIVTAIDAVKLTQEDWESITASFSEGKLLIRSLPPGEGGTAFFLALIADSRLNPSFATVAIRVAMGKLKAVLQGGGAPVGGGASSTAATLPRSGGGFSQLKAPATDVATSGLSWSGFGDQSATGSGIAVADPASAAWLTMCTRALAKYVGPMAKLFVKEAVRKVCPDRPFSQAAAEALIAELTKNIVKPADVSQFRATVLKSS